MLDLKEISSARRRAARHSSHLHTEKSLPLAHVDSGHSCDSTVGLADAQQCDFSSSLSLSSSSSLSSPLNGSPGKKNRRNHGTQLKGLKSLQSKKPLPSQPDTTAGIFSNSPTLPAASFVSTIYQSRSKNSSSNSSIKSENNSNNNNNNSNNSNYKNYNMGNLNSDSPLKITSAQLQSKLPKTPIFSQILLLAITVASFFTRFLALSYPSQVVFDEVHFGKFMSYYIRRTYYFDVHPPLGRLMFALVGWVAGFDGSFLFDNIGDDYIKNKIPHVLLRTLPAFCGSLVAPIAFETLRHMGFSTHASFLAAVLIILDNALTTQSRLIMLDSALILFATLCIYTWVRFSKAARTTLPFSADWWKWLLLTGAFLGCVIGIKMVGLFTVATIGAAVLFDLWYLLDERICSLKEFAKHFAARAAALIVLPCGLYLLWFYLHFTILSKSGPGDGFMSPSFQATLHGNKHSGDSDYVPYGAIVTIKHINTNGYLHSHPERYPLRYADNRVSSQGQQVTVYPHSDQNNNWRILPADPSQWDTTIYSSIDSPPRLVQHNDLVVLQHVRTNSHLLTHDVASPLTPTNQEFTTVAEEKKLSLLNMTVFRIDMGKEFKDMDPGPARALTTLSSHFKLIHVVTGVAMFTHVQPLPAWGFGQQEVNGNKNPSQSENNWYVESTDNGVFGANAPPAPPSERLRRPSFLSKFIELLTVMVAQNSQITKPHPFTSLPHTWPLFRRGISYWQSAPGKQIYLMSNAASYALVLGALTVYLGATALNALSARRGTPLIVSRHTRARVNVSLGFLLFAWAAHYVPFFGMGRSLFLHHYLPASVIAYMFAGGVVDVAIRALASAVGVFASSPRASSSSVMATSFAWAITLAITSISAGFFLRYSPSTYGRAELSAAEWQERRYISTWDLLFTKPPSE